MPHPLAYIIPYILGDRPRSEVTKQKKGPVDEAGVLYRVKLNLRYTRVSCLPFGAVMALDRVVRANDEVDAQRQACLCLAEELEDILAAVNAMNVSEVRVDFAEIQPTEPDNPTLWNPVPFPPELTVPRHIVQGAALDGETVRSGRRASGRR